MAVRVHIHVAGSTPKDHVVDIAAPTTLAWVESWHVTPALDVWAAARSVAGCIELEVEVSNASFYPGRKARAWVPNATVTVSAGSGFALVQDAVRPWPSVWPTKRAAWRRYGLYPAGKSALRIQAQILARGTLVESPNFADWGPAGMPLPTLRAELASSLVDKWEASYIGLRAHLTTGATSGWYAEDPEDAARAKPGGWIVWGPDDPGAPAGSGVYFSTGWQRVLGFARYALLAAQCAHERMWHGYHRGTGKPITVDDYGPVTPKYSPGTHDPNNNDLPEFRDVATQDALPDPYATSHRVRHDRYPIAVHELTGSPMAKRMVAGAAAQIRLQWSERGETDQWSYNIRNMLERVKANPHQGLSGTYGGRSLGEPAFVFAAARKFGIPGGDDWARMFLEMLETACPPHGVIQRAWEPSGAWSGGPHDLAHFFEVPMLAIGAIGLARQFNLPIPAQIATALRSTLLDPSLLRPYYSSNVGPWDYLYVGAHDGAAYAKIPGGQTTPGAPEGDATHAELGCALGYSVTGDPAFLDAMCTVGLPAANRAAKREQLESASGLDWSAFALAQLQSTGRP